MSWCCKGRATGYMRFNADDSQSRESTHLWQALCNIPRRDSTTRSSRERVWSSSLKPCFLLISRMRSIVSSGGTNRSTRERNAEQSENSKGGRTAHGKRVAARMLGLCGTTEKHTVAFAGTPGRATSPQARRRVTRLQWHFFAQKHPVYNTLCACKDI